MCGGWGPVLSEGLGCVWGPGTATRGFQGHSDTPQPRRADAAQQGRPGVWVTHALLVSLSLQHANKQLPGGGVQGKFKNRELHKQRREGCEGQQTARSGSPALSTAVQGGLSLSLPQTTPQ